MIDGCLKKTFIICKNLGYKPNDKRTFLLPYMALKKIIIENI